MKFKDMAMLGVQQYIRIKKKNNLKKVDKKICALHKEWIGLNKYENKHYKGNEYAYKAFKNIYGKSSDYFVSDIMYQTMILPILNRCNYSKEGRNYGHTYFMDKNYQEIFIRGINSLHSIVHNINGVFFNEKYRMVSKDDALLLMETYDELVYKKTIETGHGKGVMLIKRAEYKDVIDTECGDYVIQEVLKQHESFAKFNESSVNVVRITTLFWRGDIYVLGGVLRIGAPGSFCDHLACEGKYPLVVGISENGELLDKVIDCERGYIYGDIYGKRINDVILKYETMKDLVTKEHMKYPKHGIIGWDLTIDKDGEIRCIEYNVRCPGIVQTQYALGPIFSKKTKRGNTLLDEIINEKNSDLEV